jgi:hypothetical protein
MVEEFEIDARCEAQHPVDSDADLKRLDEWMVQRQPARSFAVPKRKDVTALAAGKYLVPALPHTIHVKPFPWIHEQLNNQLNSPKGPVILGTKWRSS